MKTYDLLNMDMDELICWLQDNPDLLMIDKDEAFDKAWQAFNQSKEPTAKGQLKDALEAIFND